MHIGLIGGIGPAATVSYYRLLVAAFNAAELPLELTIVHASISQLVSNASQDNKDAQAVLFGSHLRQLKGAGCDIAAITALTGHFCFEETEALSPLPLMNVIKEIDSHCQSLGIKKLGLLGGPSVLETKLFGLIKGPEVVVPERGLRELGEAYMATASSGVCTDESRKLFFDAGAEMVSVLGADTVLLGGTDLGLAFDNHEPGFPIIDPLEVHIDAIVNLARGQK